MKKIMILCCSLCLLMTGCMRKPTTPEPSPVPTVTPSVSRLQEVMDYLDQHDIDVSDNAPVSSLDFNALEGKTFSYQDQMIYLYRFDRDNPEGKKMLDYATENGKMKVIIDGREMEYTAYVNEDMILFYDSEEPLEALRQIYVSYPSMAE